MSILIQLLESHRLTPLADGEWLYYGKEARFHYLVNQPQAAIKVACQCPLVAMTTSAIILLVGPSMAVLTPGSNEEFKI